MKQKNQNSARYSNFDEAKAQSNYSFNSSQQQEDNELRAEIQVDDCNAMLLQLIRQFQTQNRLINLSHSQNGTNAIDLTSSFYINDRFIQSTKLKIGFDEEVQAQKVTLKFLKQDFIKINFSIQTSSSSDIANNNEMGGHYLIGSITLPGYDMFDCSAQQIKNQNANLFQEQGNLISRWYLLECNLMPLFNEEKEERKQYQDIIDNQPMVMVSIQFIPEDVSSAKEGRQLKSPQFQFNAESSKQSLFQLQKNTQETSPSIQSIHSQSQTAGIGSINKNIQPNDSSYQNTENEHFVNQLRRKLQKIKASLDENSNQKLQQKYTLLQNQYMQLVTELKQQNQVRQPPYLQECFQIQKNLIKAKINELLISSQSQSSVGTIQQNFSLVDQQFPLQSQSKQQQQQQQQQVQQVDKKNIVQQEEASKQQYSKQQQSYASHQSNKIKQTEQHLNQNQNNSKSLIKQQKINKNDQQFNQNVIEKSSAEKYEYKSPKQVSQQTLALTQTLPQTLTQSTAAYDSRHPSTLGEMSKKSFQSINKIQNNNNNYTIQSQQLQQQDRSRSLSAISQNSAASQLYLQPTTQQHQQYQYHQYHQQPSGTNAKTPKLATIKRANRYSYNFNLKQQQLQNVANSMNGDKVVEDFRLKAELFKTQNELAECKQDLLHKEALLHQKEDAHLQAMTDLQQAVSIAVKVLTVIEKADHAQQQEAWVGTIFAQNRFFSQEGVQLKQYLNEIVLKVMAANQVFTQLKSANELLNTELLNQSQSLQNNKQQMNSDFNSYQKYQQQFTPSKKQNQITQQQQQVLTLSEMPLMQQQEVDVEGYQVTETPEPIFKPMYQLQQQQFSDNNNRQNSRQSQFTHNDDNDEQIGYDQRSIEKTDKNLKSNTINHINDDQINNNDEEEQQILQVQREKKKQVKQQKNNISLKKNKNHLLKVKNGKLVVRIGGGFQNFEEFLQTYTIQEMKRIHNINESTSKKHKKRRKSQSQIAGEQISDRLHVSPIHNYKNTQNRLLSQSPQPTQIQKNMMNGVTSSQFVVPEQEQQQQLLKKKTKPKKYSASSKGKIFGNSIVKGINEPFKSQEQIHPKPDKYIVLSSHSNNKQQQKYTTFGN